MFMNAKSILFIKFAETRAFQATYPQLVLNLLLDSSDCVALAEKYQEGRPECAEDFFTEVSHRDQDVSLLEFLLVPRNHLQPVAFRSSHLNKGTNNLLISRHSRFLPADSPASAPAWRCRRSCYWWSPPAAASRSRRPPPRPAGRWPWPRWTRRWRWRSCGGTDGVIIKYHVRGLGTNLLG